jgi:hypothetical protein
VNENEVLGGRVLLLLHSVSHLSDVFYWGIKDVLIATEALKFQTMFPYKQKCWKREIKLQNC